MIGTTNAVGSAGGLKATDAILRVIAPAGSTVTISKGAVSKSDQGHENASDNTLYDYYFIIHASQFDSVNPWTVTATLGTQSISDTVIIDSADAYDVVISYTLYLVKDGIAQDGAFIAVGKKLNAESSAGEATPTVTQNTGYITIGLASSSGGAFGMAYLPNQYDLSKYNKVRVVGQARCENATMNNLGFSAWSAIGTYQQDNLLIREKILESDASSYVSVDKTYDVSLITASSFVGFNFGKLSNVQSYIRIYDWWLEA